MKTLLKYDSESVKSIFEYSKGLLGHTLCEFAPDDYQCRKGKGGLGEMVEENFFWLRQKQQSRR